MVWGCMSSKGVGRLVVIKGIMDKYSYKTILTENLRPSAVEMGIKDDLIFQQDNDPKHKSDIVEEFFEKKDTDDVLDWPSQSPDLNPVEYLWDHLKSEVRKFNLTSKKNLEAKVMEIWKNISPDVCKRLDDTMNSRVNCVLRAKGKHIPY